MDDKLIDYYRPPLVRMNISFLKHTMTYNFFKRHYNKPSRQIWKIKFKKECLTQNHLKWRENKQHYTHSSIKLPRTTWLCLLQIWQSRKLGRKRQQKEQQRGHLNTISRNYHCWFMPPASKAVGRRYALNRAIKLPIINTHTNT